MKSLRVIRPFLFLTMRKNMIRLAVGLAFIFSFAWFVARSYQLKGLQAQDIAEPPTAMNAIAPRVAALKADASLVRRRNETALPSQRFAVTPEQARLTRRLAPFDLKSHRPKVKDEIGLTRPLKWKSANENSVETLTQKDGSQLRIYSFQSPGALEMRVHFTDFNLAEGEEVVVYGVGEKSFVSGPFQGQGRVFHGQPGGNFWTETIQGDTVFIEHSGATTLQGSFSVPDIAHHYTANLDVDFSGKSPSDKVDPLGSGAVLSCHRDASCSPNILNNAVGKILFIEGDSVSRCSGTLLASTEAGTLANAPYFLTANHCLRTEGVACTVQPIWMFQSDFCNSGKIRSDVVVSTVGASLLKTRQIPDQTLLRILTPLPLNVARAGWESASPPAGTASYGIHHPRGAYLRRSEGPVSDTNEDCAVTGLKDGYKVDWEFGLTEKGSSGSGLFRGSDNKLFGVLSCGPEDVSCSSKYGIYGKFSHFFPEIASYLQFGDRGPNPTAPLPPLGNNTPLVIQDTLTNAMPARVYGEASEGIPYYGKVYAFSGKAGQRFRLSLGSNAFAPSLMVLAPGTRQKIADLNAGAPGTTVSTIVTLPRDSSTTLGAYLIEATSNYAGQTGAFTLTIQKECEFKLSTNEIVIPAAKTGGSFDLSSTGYCEWTGTSNASWIDLFSSTSGTGSKEIVFGADANDSTASRTATLNFGGQTLTITQRGKCVAQAISAGQNVSGTLSASNDCLSPSSPLPPVDKPYADLYTFTGGQGLSFFFAVTSPSLNPTLRLFDATGKLVTEGTSAELSAFLPNGGFKLPATGTYTLEVSSKTRQTGSYSLSYNTNCTYAVSPTSVSVAKGGIQTARVDVTAPNGCLWEASAPASWLVFNTLARGNGNGNFNYSVNANAGDARATNISIADKTVSIAQASGCVFTITPTSRAFTSSGGAGTINVTASNAECSWAVSLNAPAGMITYPLVLGSKKGNGAVNYTVNPNTGATARTATFTVAGQTHTITQAAVSPNPVPAVSGFVPSYVSAGHATFVLGITGTNFMPRSTVRVAGQTLEANFISETRLEVELDATMVKNPAELSVIVTNPTPGGGNAPERKFPVYGSLANVSAASYKTEVSPNSIVAVFGNNLARGIEIGRTIPLPTDLLGTTVKLRDRAGKELLAQLFFVSPTQVNYLFPAGLASGPILVTITSGSGTISVGELTLGALAPALFAANSDGEGAPAAVVLRVLANGQQVYENVNTFDRTLNRWVPLPIIVNNRGEQVYLILYGSGIRGNSGLSNTFAYLGRGRYAVGYAGAQGGLVGLDQVNLLLPAALAGSGEIALSLNVDGMPSNAMLIAVR